VMMNHTMKSRCKVSPHTVIEGKWHRNRYTIIKELGYGANGVVYLARSGHRLVALKLSENGMSITSEVNVLKSFSKVQGRALGPCLLDVDDWVTQSGKISFYVMEYIKGLDLLSYIQKKGYEWTYVLILQLLSDLEKLHQNGWVFGDLKPENLIVTGHPPRIRCIDVGGTTLQGRAIKEYTEFFDRGYWRMGSRKAEVSYDLFAVAMILINTAYPKRFQKTSGGLSQLQTMIEQKKELKKLQPVLLAALQGTYSSAAEMRSHMVSVINRPDRNSSRHGVSRQYGKTSRSLAAKQKKRGGTMETMIISSVILLLYALYIYGQL
jgi:hypothetical protein